MRVARWSAFAIAALVTIADAQNIPECAVWKLLNSKTKTQPMMTARPTASPRASRIQYVPRRTPTAYVLMRH